MSLSNRAVLATRVRRVFLTPKARRRRDAYPGLVMEIEDRWREQYAAAISPMRTALMAMNERFDVDLPDYPEHDRLDSPALARL